MEGRKPVGRPKKTWSKIVEEYMRKLNITEDMAETIKDDDDDDDNDDDDDGFDDDFDDFDDDDYDDSKCSYLR